MPLYFINTSSDDQDRDLIVKAPDPEGAMRYWRKYYKEDDLFAGPVVMTNKWPLRENALRIMKITQTGFDGPLQWNEVGLAGYVKQIAYVKE